MFIASAPDLTEILKAKKGESIWWGLIYGPSLMGENLKINKSEICTQYAKDCDPC